VIYVLSARKNQVARSIRGAALLALALAACSGAPPTPEAMLEKGAAEMRASIHKTVGDLARRNQLLDRTDALERALRGHAGDYKSFVEEFRRLNDAYDTPRGQIETLFARFEARRRAGRDGLLDLHLQMLSLASADEWPHIAKAEIDLLQTIGALPAEDDGKGAGR
jgi:hypothetical protein